MAINQPTPAVLSQGTGLRVLDYDDKELPPTKADATGTAAILTDPLPQGYIWRIERIVVTGDSSNECQLAVYVNDTALPQRARDFTPFPPGLIAVAEYPSYLTLKSGVPLLVNVTGANEGDIFTASVQYQLVQKVLGQGQWPSS